MYYRHRWLKRKIPALSVKALGWSLVGSVPLVLIGAAAVYWSMGFLVFVPAWAIAVVWFVQSMTEHN